MLFRNRNRIYNIIIKIKQINVSDNIQKPKKICVSSFITVRNSSCGKVIFLHLSVILFTGGVSAKTPPGQTSLARQTPPARQTPQFPLDRHPP